jgi:hypothetical protein
VLQLGEDALHPASEVDARILMASPAGVSRHAPYRDCRAITESRRKNEDAGVANQMRSQLALVERWD